MIFQTERLEVRYLIDEDFDSLFRMYSDPDMWEYFPDGVRSADETREELTWFRHGDPADKRLGLWAVIQKSDGRFVGRCGLLGWQVDGQTEIEIAYMIDKAFWRQGFGAEIARGLVQHGFETTDVPHLIALTDHNHTASIKTAESAGLSYWKDIFMDGVESAVYKIDRPNA